MGETSSFKCPTQPLERLLPNKLLTPINCNYRTLHKYVKKIRSFLACIDHGLTAGK